MARLAKVMMRTTIRPFDDDESWRRYLADLRRLPVAAPVRRRALAHRAVLLGAVLRDGRRCGRRHGRAAGRLHVLRDVSEPGGAAALVPVDTILCATIKMR